MSRCVGCGILLQNTEKSGLGYTSNLENNLCERCFRIKNYNEYKFVIKSNDDYIEILKSISNSDCLVVLVVDLFNISKQLNNISKYIKNNVLLVLTKRDVLPKSCYDKKFIDYFKTYNINILDTAVVSSKKNYNLDCLYEKIKLYNKNNKVYFVGFTNSGKSTLINKLIYNYSNIDFNLTTSNLPSTTLDTVEIKIDDELTLIDTPGILDDGDISCNVDCETLKKVIPAREINPITYQVNKKQTILIDNLARIDLTDKNSMTIYCSDKLGIRRFYHESNDLKELNRYDLKLEPNEDVVIQGLCFLKFTNAGHVTVYSNGVSVFVRKNLI